MPPIDEPTAEMKLQADLALALEARRQAEVKDKAAAAEVERTQAEIAALEHTQENLSIVSLAESAEEDFETRYTALSLEISEKRELLKMQTVKATATHSLFLRTRGAYEKIARAEQHERIGKGRARQVRAMGKAANAANQVMSFLEEAIQHGEKTAAALPSHCSPPIKAMLLDRASIFEAFQSELLRLFPEGTWPAQQLSPAIASSRHIIGQRDLPMSQKHPAIIDWFDESTALITAILEGRKDSNGVSLVPVEEVIEFTATAPDIPLSAEQVLLRTQRASEVHRAAVNEQLGKAS